MSLPKDERNLAPGAGGMGNSESGLQAEEVVDETKVTQLYVSRLESTMNSAEYPERICFRFFSRSSEIIDF